MTFPSARTILLVMKETNKVSTREGTISAEAKLTGALLYTFEDGGLSAQKLADVLSPPPEKVASVFSELTGNGYLEILEENGAFRLHPKG